jgi:hypothetical protein
MGAGFLLAVVGTVLPWSAPNFSHYTGLFGGWGFSPIAWSLVAAASATLGAAAWVVAARTATLPWLAWGLPIAGVVTMAGTILFVIWPPFATGPWLGPWITLSGSAVVLGGALSERRPRGSATTP